MREIDRRDALRIGFGGMILAGAGVSLWANAMRALEHIGAAHAVRAVGRPAGPSEMRTHRGHRTAMSYSCADLERAYGVKDLITMTHRAELVPGTSVPLFELRPPVFDGFDYVLKRSFDFVGAYTEFATGKSLMCYPVGNFGTPVIDSIAKGKINYDLFAFPPMKAGVTPVATGGAAIIWSVPTKTKNPDAALELARVFSSSFGTKALIKVRQPHSVRQLMWPLWRCESEVAWHELQRGPAVGYLLGFVLAV